MVRAIYSIANSSSSMHPGCMAAQPHGEQWRCNMAQFTYPHIKSPIFLLNSVYDSWQLACILTSEWPTNPECKRDVTVTSLRCLSKRQLQRIAWLADLWTRSFCLHAKSGLDLTALVTHTEPIGRHTQPEH